MTTLTTALKVFADQVDTLIDKMNNNSKQRRGEEEDRNRVLRRRKISCGWNYGLESNTGNQCDNNIYMEKADIPLFFGTLGVEDFLN